MQPRPIHGKVVLLATLTSLVHPSQFLYFLRLLEAERHSGVVWLPIQPDGSVGHQTVNSIKFSSSALLFFLFSSSTLKGNIVSFHVSHRWFSVKRGFFFLLPIFLSLRTHTQVKQGEQVGDKGRSGGKATK